MGSCWELQGHLFSICFDHFDAHFPFHFHFPSSNLAQQMLTTGTVNVELKRTLPAVRCVAMLWVQSVI